MANNLTLGTIEVHLEHSGDESEDDDDDVVEQSPCGRWEKRRQEVIKQYVGVVLELHLELNFVVSVCVCFFKELINFSQLSFSTSITMDQRLL